MQTPRAESPNDLETRVVDALAPGDHVLLVVAHPDDEVIGCGSRLRRWAGRLTVVHATNGSPRPPGDRRAAGFRDADAYAAARRRESIEAMRVAGVPAGARVELGHVDQEASAHAAEIADAVAALARDRRATILVAAPYEGGHPDHDAVAWAVQAAADRVARHGGPRLMRIECTAYHAGASGIETGRFLPPPDARAREEWRVALTADERVMKRRMLACFATQQATLAPFGVEEERFRVAPVYDFARRPHPGPLFYEHFDWGIRRWEEWAALVDRAAAG